MENLSGLAARDSGGFFSFLFFSFSGENLVVPGDEPQDTVGPLGPQPREVLSLIRVHSARRPGAPAGPKSSRRADVSGPIHRFLQVWGRHLTRFLRYIQEKSLIVSAVCFLQRQEL